MTVAIRTITFDCADAHTLALFWANLTDWHVFHDEDPEVLVARTTPTTASISSSSRCPRARA